MPNLTNRFGISALSIKRYAEAINEEIMIDKRTGQISIKSNQGIIGSFDKDLRNKLIKEKLVKRNKDYYEPVDMKANNSENDVIGLPSISELLRNENIKYPIILDSANATINSSTFGTPMEVSPYKVQREIQNHQGPPTVTDVVVAGLQAMYIDASYWEVIDKSLTEKTYKEIENGTIYAEIEFAYSDSSVGGTVKVMQELNKLNSSLEWFDETNFPSWRDGKFINEIKSIKFTGIQANAILIVHNIYLLGFLSGSSKIDYKYTRFDILPILSAAIKDHLGDYDKTKTYNKGDIIYRAHSDNFLFLMAKEDGITGEFNNSKWELAPKGFVPGLKTGKSGTTKPAVFIKTFDTMENARLALKGDGIDANTFTPDNSITVLEYSN